VRRVWEPLPADMSYGRANLGLEAVAGGLLVSGSGKKTELYDEASGHWFTLPHQMEAPRAGPTVLLPC
jgi:hypothetical protein